MVVIDAPWIITLCEPNMLTAKRVRAGTRVYCGGKREPSQGAKSFIYDYGLVMDGNNQDHTGNNILSLWLSSLPRHDAGAGQKRRPKAVSLKEVSHDRGTP